VFVVPLLPNAFIGKPEHPADEELTAELGAARTLWDQLLARMAEECKVLEREWNSYSRKAGWSLRLKIKERNIVYLSPCRGSFRGAFVLGDKAVRAARRSKLPERVLKIIAGSTRYAEGTAVRLAVKGARDLDAIVTLAQIKIAN